jgi:hypothetical protein
MSELNKSPCCSGLNTKKDEGDLLPQEGILNVEEDENPISAVNQGRRCTDCDRCARNFSLQ